MKKTALAILALVALAGGAEWMVLASSRVEPGKLAGALVSLALVLGLFIALTEEGGEVTKAGARFLGQFGADGKKK